MTRRTWIIVLVAGGIGLAILIGVLGTRNEPSNSSSGPNRAQAASTLCSSLKNLGGSIQTLVGLGTSGTKDEYQSDVTAVQTAWGQVQTDYQTLKNAPPGDLSNAWSNFDSAVKAVPDSDSASDAVNSIKQSADALQSAAQTTASQLSCS